MSERNHSHRWLIAGVIVPIAAALIGAAAIVYSSRIQVSPSQAAKEPSSGQAVDHGPPGGNESSDASVRAPAVAGALRNIEGRWDLPAQECKYPIRIEVIGEEIVLTRSDGVENARYRMKSANETSVRTQEGPEFSVYSDALVYSGRRFRRCD